MSKNLEINKREYPSSFSKTAIVICLDGSQKEYIDIASSKGLTPNLDKILENGQYLMANSAIPSFTNPNNISICLLYTSPSPRDATLSRMPSSA